MSALGNKQIFSQNLNYYMAVNNKTRSDICRDLGFKYSTFAEWASGKKYPRIDKIEMLANYFGIQKSDLIEDKPRDPVPRAIEYDELMEVLVRELSFLSEENKKHMLKMAQFFREQEDAQNKKE